MPDKPAIHFESVEESRYDRQQLISWWDQRKLAETRVIVAGAGALGNEVLKLLALTGVGHILLVDFDVISRSNLARMVLFREQDVGRPKVEVAAERLREINPDVEIRAVQGDLRFDVGLGDYRAADLVLGCLDSVNARWALNRKCMLAGVEWIDGGISEYHGLVARYSPHAEGCACYECTFTPRTQERFNRRYSCPFGLAADQAENKVPTTAVTTSMIAAIQVQQALMQIHGEGDGLQPGERLMVYLKPYQMTRDHLPYNPDCLAHFTLPEEITVLRMGRTSSLREVFLRANEYLPGVEALGLDYDLVIEFYCRDCGTHASILRPKEKVRHLESVCPQCKQLREPLTVSSIRSDSPLADLMLAEIGLPPREILTFMQGSERVYLQLDS